MTICATWFPSPHHWTLGATRTLVSVLCTLFLCVRAVHAQASATSSSVRSVFSFESDPGDYLGGGRTAVFDQGSFTASHALGFLNIEYREGNGPRWSLVFLAPRGNELTVGTYGATSAPSPRQYGIDISGEHRFCSFLKGSFSILEAVYNASGDVERIAIDFEVRCANRETIFSGAVRINSDRPLPGLRTPTPTPLREDSTLRLRGEIGDPITGGWPVDYDAQNARFLATAGGQNSSVRLILFDPAQPELSGQAWDLFFGAPACQQLLPGTYEGALQSLERGLSDGSQPGLEVQKFGPSLIGACRELAEGRFVVREVVYGEHGEVYRFAADFEQRCTDATGRLLGSLSYTSSRPTPTPAPPSPTPTDYSSVLALYSQKGDFVGACQNRYLTLADGDFYGDGNPGYVKVFFDGGPNSWELDFAAPAGEALIPKTYRNARCYPFHDRGLPGMAVSGEGRACDANGKFTVHEIEFEKGRLSRFSADFEQHCGGAIATLYGTVHFRSNAPPPTPRQAGAPTPTPALGPCWGDCSQDGRITVDELVLAVKIALGESALSTCSVAEVDGDGSVTVADIVPAVFASLIGCAPEEEYE